jgi:hypothetical protein
VYVYGTFTMNDGTISGNKASGGIGFGGGVYVHGTATFTKSGGTIYGNTGDTNKNIAKNNTMNPVDTYGHAVYYYYYYSDRYYRDTTLDSTSAGNISSEATLPANPDETLNGWTKQ